MQSDFSVELGTDDPVLEIPWKSDDGSLYYVVLKSAPERVNELAEVSRFPELRPFLLNLNQRDTPLLTAKCDAWFSRDLLPEEDIFNTECKLVCYVDLIFALDDSRRSFSRHEQYAKDVCALLQQYPDNQSSAELIIRRCYYRIHQSVSGGGMQQEDFGGQIFGGGSHSAHAEACFCFTLYVSGFGSDETQARRHWAMALQILQEALLQTAGIGH